MKMKTAQTFFHQLIMLYRPFEHNLNEILNENNLHRAQWTILYYLYHQGPATSVMIATYLNVEKPTVARAFKSLKTQRYVETIVGKDRREKLMQLTDLGKETYENVRIRIDAFEQEILSGVTKAEQETMIETMNMIRNNIMK